MKQITVFLLVFVLMLSVAGCRRGDTRLLETNIGASQVYTQEEIEDAIAVVTAFFGKEFEGCSLLTIEYDEAQYLAEAQEWAEQYQADQAIVLESSFYVGICGGDGSLNQDEIYRNWKWILTRNYGEAWSLETWGYG